MFSQFVDQILFGVEAARYAYHRLVLVVGPAGSGKTTTLKEVHRKTSVPLVNLNLTLSKMLMEINENLRPIRITPIMETLLNDHSAEVLIFDNTELLFEPSLKQDPLRLLQQFSRNQTIVASWNGKIENNTLIYGIPGHPEYRSYSASELTIIQLPETR